MLLTSAQFECSEEMLTILAMLQIQEVFIAPLGSKHRAEVTKRAFSVAEGDFVTMHLDTNLAFDTIYFGNKEMTLLQKASYWATGRGNFGGVKITEDWKVK